MKPVKAWAIVDKKGNLQLYADKFTFACYPDKALAEWFLNEDERSIIPVLITEVKRAKK